VHAAARRERILQTGREGGRNWIVGYPTEDLKKPRRIGFLFNGSFEEKEKRDVKWINERRAGGSPTGTSEKDLAKRTHCKPNEKKYDKQKLRDGYRFLSFTNGTLEGRGRDNEKIREGRSALSSDSKGTLGYEQRIKKGAELVGKRGAEGTSLVGTVSLPRALSGQETN